MTNNAYKPVNLEEIAAHLATCGEGTKIYLGADSDRFKIQGVWHYDVALVCVVHLNGRNGCKIFGEIQRERDYDRIAKKPSMRLMDECYKVCAFYDRLKNVLEESCFDIQIHLDLNPNEREVSSIVINQAIGYVRAACNIIPFAKPDSWAASYAADRWKEIRHYRGAKI